MGCVLSWFLGFFFLVMFEAKGILFRGLGRCFAVFVSPSLCTYSTAVGFERIEVPYSGI
jgi:hypothetical protein